VSALERELASRGIDLLDHASLDHRLRRRSGDGAKRKCRTDGQRGDGFMSIDVFIVSSFPTRAYWARCLPALQLRLCQFRRASISDLI
jgi:hypothetical protein